ncbi:DUF938 domain-containing protein [Sulfitobacter mediterraneus]|uniref:DUF938 domain-containing protein n=1 Tax=Sulfitobacter mediterraneus TaxID=83219 RepID=UPI00193360B0|nr:DUF938 domain-containing protein [Sulfitobacter mediterraneus]MBM1634735.1 DUF938 domain-containing protein [Sulfitobacter mediterraneus]MBM1642554.1 DUF938 domain-containing protein [Sulfitobacter mediterraneus]MBM1646602.1 DUF938 domain-containing protein [Sulfitobacter mediterraneus]MBM1650647.1 DUF938 domain-containing protein [Sulfitobacter mediterraneus]MBM1654670.1 DUF938 domain-containing protein [Sulfitobacter mediterraneus]
MTRKLPSTASVAIAQDGAKLHAPAAARNAQALRNLLLDHAPKTGRALEIASGTGQHIVEFATALPGLHWQPTDIEAERRASIDAHVAEAGLSNVAPAAHLNAAEAGWHDAHAPFDLIVLVNLLHLISEAEVRTVITEAAKALRPQGVLVLYGPFKREGRLTSEGDVRFHDQLRTADPAIGYKDTLDMRRWLGDAGLTAVQTIEMPANNLAFVSRKI